MKPMLAKKFRPDRAIYPLFCQPKYNGIRALFLRNHFQSRDQHQWDPAVLPHLLTELTELGIPFDGELYCHGMSLQQINARVAVNRRSVHDDVQSVKYYIFDIISREPFHRRAQALESLSMRINHPSIVFAPTYRIESQKEGDYYFKQFIGDKYEGMMIRTPNDPYGLETECGNQENRWNYLTKRKERMDVNAKIMEVNEGTGKYQGAVGSFTLQLLNGIMFNAGSGLTDDERNTYWKYKDDILGLNVRVEFEMFSDDGVPLKPTIALVDVAF